MSAHRLAATAFLLSALTAKVATASSLRCEGEMRLPDCRAVTQDEYDWPSSSQPTFTVQCTGCPSPNPTDGGPPQTCMPWPPRASQFTLTVAGQSYRNLAAGGAQTIYFEETETVCEGQKLFRYKGPLQPGKKHEIDLGGHDWPELPITFYVALAPTSGPTAQPDAPVDSPSASDESPGASGGCSCALGGGTMLSRSAIGPWILALLGGVLRKHRRRRD